MDVELSGITVDVIITMFVVCDIKSELGYNVLISEDRVNVAVGPNVSDATEVCTALGNMVDD